MRRESWSQGSREGARGASEAALLASTFVPAIPLLMRPWAPLWLDSFERLLWWLFAGSAGAATRATVLFAIREQPRNAQQLSQKLNLDYTTVRHHLRVMEANRIVLTEGEKYGKIYFVSEAMEAHWDKLQDILKKTRKPTEVKRK